MKSRNNLGWNRPRGSPNPTTSPTPTHLTSSLPTEPPTGCWELLLLWLWRCAAPRQTPQKVPMPITHPSGGSHPPGQEEQPPTTARSAPSRAGSHAPRARQHLPSKKYGQEQSCAEAVHHSRGARTSPSRLCTCTGYFYTRCWGARTAKRFARTQNTRNCLRWSSSGCATLPEMLLHSSRWCSQAAPSPFSPHLVPSPPAIAAISAPRIYHGSLPVSSVLFQEHKGEMRV